MKLAIDVVMMGVAREYDVAIIASCDTDLSPAVEALLALGRKQGGKPAVEVIVWEGRPNRIGVSGVQLTERLIDRADYENIKDLRVYNLSS